MTERQSDKDGIAAPQQGPADTEEMKRARLPRVVRSYARAIRRKNERGEWPVDSGFAGILERAADALDAAVPELGTRPPAPFATWQEYAEAGHRRAEEYQTINGHHNTTIDSLREQLATLKADIRARDAVSAIQPIEPPPEIRLDDKGAVDEVCTPTVHLERLDKMHWFLSVSSGGKELALWIGKKGATYEWRPLPAPVSASGLRE